MKNILIYIIVCYITFLILKKSRTIISGFNNIKDEIMDLFENVSSTFVIDNLSSQAQDQQITPLSLLSLNDLQDREDIITDLQKDMNVSIAVDDPQVLTPYLLSYLYN